MERSNRKILLASTFLAVPLAFIALSFSTAADPVQNPNAGPIQPGGIVHAIGRATASKSANSGVQPTGLLDGLLQKNKAKANAKVIAERPAPNWDGIPFHTPTRTNRVSNVPIRDVAPPPRVASSVPTLPSPPAVKVREPARINESYSAQPTAAKPAAARLSRSSIQDSTSTTDSSRRLITGSPTIQPLSKVTSKRRSGRQSIKPLDQSEIAARATKLDAPRNGETIDELVPKVPRRMLTKPAPKPAAKPAPLQVAKKEIVKKPVPAREIAPTKKVAVKPVPVLKKPVAPAPQVVQPKVVAATPKPAPIKTTLAAPKPKTQLAPMPPTRTFKAPSTVVSHRAGPPETAFEPRQALEGRAVRPLTPAKTMNPSATMNAVLPIGSGVADPGNNEGSMKLSPLVSPPDARVAQRPFPSQGQPFPADPYANRNAVSPIQQMRTPATVDRTLPSGNATPLRQHVRNNYHPTPAAPIERATGGQATKDITNDMRRERKPDSGQTTVTSELPGIRVATHGPREITIRQTHQFEIHVENRGSIDAKGVMVRALIPEWAEMRGQNATTGEIGPQGKKGEERLVWTIDHLPAGSSERMFVRVKAKRSGTHGLDVDWTLAPQKSVAQIQVHEPELRLTIEGPSEIVFGESQTYKVRVLNPGDGIAPNVVFTLSPNSSTPQTQRIGDIPPGKEAQFEVELTAQDLGDLKIDGLASGDLELRADAAKTIRVSAAELEALFSGPEVKYQDTDATYTLQVQNKGSATSKNVMASLKLPVGVKYLGGLDGATQRGNIVQWSIESLTPGTARDYQFRCNMNTTGDQTFAFQCKGSAAGKATVEISTQVESISDLVMTINDPAAPAPVGSEVGYEIVIRNRGSRAATDVRAIAQFSHGIEPLRLKGHSGEILTGQVLFDPISKIEPGQEVKLRVVAEADRAGHHRFRSEIRSGDTVLVAEEATHYMAARKERVSRRSSSDTTKSR